TANCQLPTANCQLPTANCCSLCVVHKVVNAGSHVRQSAGTSSPLPLLSGGKGSFYSVIGKRFITQLKSHHQSS
ncbi:hypothetical protein, partial [Aeromonas dhakensis]